MKMTCDMKMACDMKMTCDMKMANIFFGIQSHSSSHLCTWCDVESKQIANSGNLRTLGLFKILPKVFGIVVYKPSLAMKAPRIF